MQKLSPLMKGLVETRARADADLQNALKSVTHRTEYLDQFTTAVQRKTHKLQLSIRAAQAAATDARRVLDACDQFIRKLKNGLDPNRIEPIDGWQGRYGQRGALGQAVQKIVEDAYPFEVTTEQVAIAIQQRYSLTFNTPAERCKWKRVSIRGRLAYLYRTGLIERIHDPNAHAKKPGRWRAVPANLKGNELMALATKAGIPLTHFSGELLAPEDPEEDNLPR